MTSNPAQSIEVEQVIAARLEAVENLRKAIEEEPRGFQ
jgi:hypothetical protein